MIPANWISTLALAVGLAIAPGIAQAQLSPDGIWAIPGKVAVKIFNCTGSVCGQVVWIENPALRTPEVCGRTIIWGLRQVAANQWSDGWFLDPENGRTYNLEATQTTVDTISAEIYLGVPMFGRTETLQRRAPTDFPAGC